MKNLKIFCITLNPKHLNLIKKIGYEAVGLGEANYTSEWLQDKFGNSISYKNPNYGEYTFHYWLWKNKKIDLNCWVGFCQYRKFWLKNKESYNLTLNLNKFDIFNELLLKEISEEYNDTDVILTEEFYVNKFKLSKFIKHNLTNMIKNPELFLNKNKRTIKFHFDMWHGKGNLEKAIQKLPIKEKSDFNDFVNSEVSFNSQNMFICKDKNLLFSYYDSLFPWLEECEKIFGFDKLGSYGLKRIYGFLAERYCSYWFKKYSKIKTMPYFFKDINDFL